MSNLKGCVVAITGASSGIGEATAVMLSSRGAKVVIGGTDDRKLQAVADQIKSDGGDVVAHALDVRGKGTSAELRGLGLH